LYDLGWRLYKVGFYPPDAEDVSSIYIPLQLLHQVITLPVTAEALRRMGYDSEMATTICSTFRRIFGILLMMKKPESIIEFVKLGIDDTYLPLTKKRSGKPFIRELEARGKGKVARIDSWNTCQYVDFGFHQYAFLTPFFARPQGKICHFRLDSEQIVLPIERDALFEHRGEHRGPSVSRIKFRPLSCDFSDFQVRTSSLSPLLSPPHDSQQFRQEADGWYIMKTLSPKTSWKSFLSEVYGWKLVNGQSKSKLNIVPLLCTIESPGPRSAKTRYHLIFPSPSGDLTKLWATYPAGGDAKIHTPEWMARQCLAIADSLTAIHQNEKTKGLRIPGHAKRKSRFMRRGDIIPDRLWWFRSPTGDCEAGTLALSNFGIEGEDIYPPLTWSSPEFSVIDDPRFEYKRRIGTKANIWSLACTWLEFVTWYLKGETGREEFADSRSEEDKTGIFTDIYFRVLGNQQAAMVKPGVIEWIKGLHLEEKCTPFLHDLLAYIEKRMLVVDCNERATTLEVSEEMKKLYSRVLDSPGYGNKPSE
jgi:hypothetical protein